MNLNDAVLQSWAFGVAYLLTGEIGTADEIAHLALLTIRDERELGVVSTSPHRYLLPVIVRLSLDLRSVGRGARARGRTGMPGSAPPLATSQGSIPLMVRLVLSHERLSPEQRAAVVLRDVFLHPYEQIAVLVGTTAGNARQLVSRASARLQRHAVDVRDAASSDVEQRDPADRYFREVERRNWTSLRDALAEHVVLRSEIFGDIIAVDTIRGRAGVVDFISSELGRYGRLGAPTFLRHRIDDRSGALVLDRTGDLAGILKLHIANDTIQGIDVFSARDETGPWTFPVGLLASFRPERARNVQASPTARRCSVSRWSSAQSSASRSGAASR